MGGLAPPPKQIPKIFTFLKSRFSGRLPSIFGKPIGALVIELHCLIVNTFHDWSGLSAPASGGAGPPTKSDFKNFFGFGE